VTRGWVSCLVGKFSLEIDWEIPPGQALVLFGPSGAGKTTALRVVAGLLRPLKGHIEVGGQTVYDSEQRLWIPPHQRRVGYLTQQYHLFPHLTVAGNIGYGLPKAANSNNNGRVRELVQTFHLEGLEERRPGELSGGQQQRVALARALAPRPDALLLDEPFAALDAELRRTLRRELRSILTEARIPVMLVTHDREEALALGDAVQVIDRGRPLARGRPLEILGQPSQGRVARLVGVENLLQMRVASRHPQDGTMVCVTEDSWAGPDQRLQLEVPISDFEEGDAVIVGIRASDIILAGEQLQKSSARNQLPGRVTSVELRPPGYEVTLDCAGSPLRCHITGSSLMEMKVEPGLDLWAVCKASSCFLVQEDAPQNPHPDLPPS
jgi:molybdate transport system ATP-binding protein